MESDQAIARVICLFNCKELPEYATSPATHTLPKGGTREDSAATSGLRLPDDFHVLATQRPPLSTRESSLTEEYWYVFLVLLWPYLVSILLNSITIVVIISRRSHPDNGSKRHMYEEETSYCPHLGTLHHKLDLFLQNLGIHDHERLLYTLVSTSLFCVFLNLLDLVYLVFNHHFRAVLCLSAITTSISALLLLFVSILVCSFGPLRHRYGGACGVTVFVTVTAGLLANALYLRIIFFYPTVFFILIFLFFTLFIVLLLKPELILHAKEPLNDHLAKFITFYAISAMVSLSVVIPSRLFWQLDLALIIFVAESLGRLIFTISHPSYFLYSLFSSQSRPVPVVHRKVHPEQEEKQKHTFPGKNCPEKKY